MKHIFKGAAKLQMKTTFLYVAKIGQNITNILSCCFPQVYLHFITSNQISTYRKLNLSVTGSIYLIDLPINAKKYSN